MQKKEEILCGLGLLKLILVVCCVHACMLLRHGIRVDGI